MKKLLLTALVMLGLATFAKASGELRNTPRGEPQALATADYGGYMVFNSTFNTNFSTVCTVCSGVVWGAYFSTGVLSNLDFVDVVDSSYVATTAQMTNFTIGRFYNVNGTTSTTVGTVASGWSGYPKPVRFANGLYVKPVTAYNSIGILYYKEP